MEEPEQTWTHDWPDRLYRELETKGFESVTKFLHHHPAEPYVDAAKRIAPWVAGMQVSQLHMQEAASAGLLRAAAMDALARDLNWRLPDGWVPDGPTESRAAGAAANTTTSVVEDGAAPNLEAQMFEVYRALKAVNPAAGWKPSGPNDPLIVRAFDEGWPSGGSSPLETAMGPIPMQPQ